MYGVFLLRNILMQEKENTELIEVVRELKANGIQLILLSNIFLRNSDYFKNKYQFLQLFDKLYFSSDIGFIKPDPRAFEFVLKENDFKPEECIFFDDSERNVAAAQALGIESYIFEGASAVRQKV